MCFQQTTASAFSNFYRRHQPQHIIFRLGTTASTRHHQHRDTTQIASRLFHPESTRSLSPERPTSDATSTNTGSGSTMMWDNDDIDILVQCWAEV